MLIVRINDFSHAPNLLLFVPLYIYSTNGQLYCFLTVFLYIDAYRYIYWFFGQIEIDILASINLTITWIRHLITFDVFIFLPIISKFTPKFYPDIFQNKNIRYSKEIYSFQWNICARWIYMICETFIAPICCLFPQYVHWFLEKWMI